MMLPVLLIVDDEKGTRDGLRLGLEDDFDVYLASNLAEAESVLDSEPVDAVLTDLRLGGDSGMDVLAAALRRENPPACVVMTAYGSVDTAVEAMRRGAYHFVTKPLNLDEIDLVLKRAVRSRGLEVENVKLQTCLDPSGGLDKILGKSEPMEKIFTIIRQVAPTRATVLVEGESGTGKELVGGAIHALSGRPKDKLVIVNCAALSPQLLESELFGHEKGAFTGAMQKRIGRFEQANGGTLILDEIGEIDPGTQVKLLRVLSEKTLERVGSNDPLKVDVRLIAATNKSLKELVARGEFREDLFFRLNGVKIDMPPLRERAEDIVLLANDFLSEFARENGRPVKPLTDEAMQALLHYSWPGNVRELKTVIEHGVVMSNADRIELRHLPDFLRRAEPPVTLSSVEGQEDERKESSSSPISSQGSSEFSSSPPAVDSLSADELNLADMEVRLIKRALVLAEGNRTRAAELLGINRRTLQRKLMDIFIGEL